MQQRTLSVISHGLLLLGTLNTLGGSNRHHINAISHGLYPYFGKSGLLTNGILLLPVAADIKHTTEIFIAQNLKLAVPEHNFVSFTGGSAIENAEELEPPFTVVAITTADRTMRTEGTWKCTGTVQIITHSGDQTTPTHAILVRRIYAALTDLERDVTGSTFSFHGIDVGAMRSNQDDDLKAHADICDISVGVGG